MEHPHLAEKGKGKNKKHLNAWVTCHVALGF